MQTCAIHPKTARREEKSDKKKEERIGAQLVAEIMGSPTDTATFAISDPIWRPASLHLQPTWASQPRNCGGHDGREHACAPAVDLSALLQLTAWVERLDAINHMNAGEDQVILKIRSQAVHVLDSWARRWYVKSAMSDDDGEGCRARDAAGRQAPVRKRRPKLNSEGPRNPQGLGFVKFKGQGQG